jgi:uncharacterized protein YdeI (YjbR/CyaY-like superfamily)
MDVIYFRTSDELRAWFAQHPDATELWVGFFKKSAAEKGISYPEAVDEALCAGWIDGVRYTVDDQRYRNRFTPRRPGSNWSQVNIRRVEELAAQGRMLPAGEAAFAARKEAKDKQYSYENRRQDLGDPYEQQFRQHPEAWIFYAAQPPSYRRTAAWWVLSAKQEATRQRRLASLIEASTQGTRLPELSGAKRKPAADANAGSTSDSGK